LQESHLGWLKEGQKGLRSETSYSQQPQILSQQVAYTLCGVIPAYSSWERLSGGMQRSLGFVVTPDGATRFLQRRFLPALMNPPHRGHLAAMALNSIRYSGGKK
jgi:hypothetical protein